MHEVATKTYRFGHFKLDAGERVLFDGPRPVQLAPKVFDTLVMLVDNAGRVVSKEKLLSEVWEGAFVEENNLAQNISVLRRVLGKDAGSPFIETVPKFGYRFIAPVESVERDDLTEKYEETRVKVFVDDAADSGLLAPATSLLGSSFAPETRYVQNGDVNIAYQVVGEGPVDIVFVMGWVSHLEYFWKHHTFASFLEKLASFSRLILFDKRGTGLSDRVPLNQLPTLEQRMEDVHAVMDAVGSERAVLVGVSEGGPMCALFAATYPDRTSAVVMIGTYAKRIRDCDYPWAPTAEQREAFLEKMQTEWGGPVGIEERAPSMADDPEFRKWWAEYLRMGASPGAAVALTKMNAEIDVRHVLPHIQVPTLVIHRKDDGCLKVEEGRYVASMIPGSKFVELEGKDHLPFVGDQDSVIDEIQKFVAGVRFSGEYDRVLATVMSIRLENLDDFRSCENLRELSRTFIRQQLEFFRGREVAYGNGEVLVTFDGPARAIICAREIAKAVARIDVPVKTGLHTGECDVSNGSYSGFAVDLARKIASEAFAGEILVSRTVKDLVAGSGLAFVEHSVETFPGIDGEWQLFDVVD